ncbi:hypothetical protein ISR92_03355 [Patescibacteria group bacterium]|nr:hypothetical protein [Patescibacteria group bacterium]
MFVSGIHLKFWELFQTGHIGTMILVLFLAFWVIPARLIVYFVGRWGVGVCNSTAFVIGIGVFVILHMFPSTRALFYYEANVISAVCIMVVTDAIVGITYYQEKDWTNKTVDEIRS